MKKLSFIILILIVVTCSRCSSNSDRDHHPSEDHSDSLSSAHLQSPDSIGYRLLTLRKQAFACTLRTGGQIMADTRDVLIITSKSSGLVRFSDNYLLYPGVRVIRGQTLFIVTGEQLAEDNTELRFRQLKADLDKASANLERAERLITDKIITEEHYLSIKNEYEKIRNEYANLDANYGKNGNAIKADDNGFIKEIFVNEGQKVLSGQALASIIMERNLILKADVSPNNLDILSSVESANFRLGYNDKIYKTSEMNGRKISSGKSTGGNSFYIPVYFRIDYDPGLIEGTFAEVFLIGKKINDALIVPNTSLMEEFGKLYVFVAGDHGHFTKRYISAGYSDGENTMVLSGLSENERIVSSGAYLIKLSQMSLPAPAHSHNH